MSRLLVFAQLLLIALIAIPNPISRHAPELTATSIALFILGLIAIGAALAVMPARTLSVLPEPRSGGELVTRGIYRFIRHPMYLAVLLCGLAACLAYGSAGKWSLLALLAIVLIIKIRREERFLLARFSDYAAYRKKTKAIIPYLI
ncbi:MAG: isoprenylcysteine carboxylmethyltransferase family protein [Glaciimonas sp.]|nr:isoprenylcysteine carboxylmethyltransferase family protein [Glaciimonas sp.]